MTSPFDHDDDLPRRLEQALHQEARAVPVPDRFDQIRRDARAGRRRRTALATGAGIGVAALALAVTWFLTQDGGLTGTPQPVDPLNPLAPVTASSSPSASPSTTASSTSTSASPTASTATAGRDTTPTATASRSAQPSASASTTTLGTTVRADRIGFASPTGNILCTMDASTGVRCDVAERTWSAQSVPTSQLVDCTNNSEGRTFPQFGVIVLGASGSTVQCAGDLTTYPAIQRTEAGGTNPTGAEYRAWATSSTPLVGYAGTANQAYALPYGATAVAGRWSCTMSQTGIDCTDTQGSAGFTASRSQLSLR